MAQGKQKRLFEMLSGCGTTYEINKYNSLFVKNKGAATNYALSIVFAKWKELIKTPTQDTISEDKDEESYNGAPIRFWKANN